MSKIVKSADDLSRNAPQLSVLLCRWFNKYKRALPWRAGDTSPWGIFVSEIMLQQTTVTTALPYWLKFMERFPSPSDMAITDEDEVLAMWSGLGYYRRARNLQKAAQLMCESFGGEVPNSFDDILAMPGVGRYTAGAVASFAFNIPVPIVEANTARVLARLGAIKDNNSEVPLWELAQALLPKDTPRLHNYAIMELGSLVCKPTEPLCHQCPIADFCLAKQQNLVENIPAAKKKTEMVAKRFLTIALCSNDKWLLRRIPPNEWHAGMMEFPKTEIPSPHKTGEDTTALEQKAIKKLIRQLHIDCCDNAVYCKTIKYVVTNHKITLDIWEATTKHSTQNDEEKGLYWVATEDLGQYPYGTAMRKMVQLIMKKAKENH